MTFRGGEFSTGTTGNFHPELTTLVKLPDPNLVSGPLPTPFTTTPVRAEQQSVV